MTEDVGNISEKKEVSFTRDARVSGGAGAKKGGILNIFLHPGCREIGTIRLLDSSMFESNVYRLRPPANAHLLPKAPALSASNPETQR